jgi:NAD(P)-dependent dehydrogenase (short-subunit alcohol dehydrogenase family)
MAKPNYESPFSALLSGIADLFQKIKPIGQLTPSDRIDGKTCLVTGANSGLGKATSVQLARRGGHIVMACRSGHPEAVEQVKGESGSDAVEMAYIDLADTGSILSFCKEMRARGKLFDIAVLNAGVVPSHSRRTKQGFEEMFGVNYLANFVLVNRLLEDGTIPNSVFSEMGHHRGIPRIVFVSSETHRTAAPIDFNTFGHFREYGMSGSMREYGYSKLLVNTYASELARRLARKGKVDVAVHSLCPGAANTNIAREAPRWTQPLLKIIFALFFSSPLKACEPVVFLCCAPSLEGKTGLYLHLMDQKEPAPRATDPQIGKQLWSETERLLKNGPLS